MQTMMAGYSFAVAGGILAQAPDTNVGAAGLLIGITGLIGGVIGGLTTAFSKWAEYKLSMRRMDDWEAKATRLEAELAQAQSRIGRNSETLRAVVPVTKALAGQSGVHEAIPEQATDPDMRAMTFG